MTGTFIETRPWTDEDFSESGPLEPRLTASRSTNRCEDGRPFRPPSGDVCGGSPQKRRICKEASDGAVSALLTLVTAISTIGLQFLVGDSTARPRTSIRKRSRGRNFGSPCIFLCSCSPLGMGTLPSWDGTPFFAERERKISCSPPPPPTASELNGAFRVFRERSAVLHAPHSHTDHRRHGPRHSAGRCCGIRTLCSGVPSWTWLAMSTTLGQGLALSFLASSLWLRGRPYTVVGPVVVVALGIGVGLGHLPADVLLWGLAAQSVRAASPSSWVWRCPLVSVFLLRCSSSMILTSASWNEVICSLQCMPVSASSDGVIFGDRGQRIR